MNPIITYIIYILFIFMFFVIIPYIVFFSLSLTENIITIFVQNFHNRNFSVEHSISYNQLKSAYKYNFVSDSQLKFLEIIYFEYNFICNEYIKNKQRFNYSKIFLTFLSCIFPILVILNLRYFHFITFDQTMTLLKSPFIIFLLLPILIYLNFQQPRESCTRFSTLKSKLELEMYSFMYSLNDYALMADGKEKITFFQNRITAIFSSNITQFNQNMKNLINRENKHFSLSNKFFHDFNTLFF